MIPDFFLLEKEIWNNTAQAYLYAAATFVAVWFSLWVFRAIILQYVRRIAKKTSTDLDDVIVEIFSSLNTPFYLLLSLGAAVQFISWPPFLQRLGYGAAIAVLLYTGIRAVVRIVDYFFQRVIKKKLQEDTAFDPSVIRLLGKGAKIVVWGVALLLIAQNLGYDVTALVAGLGIGGLAVAFALQNVLSDIFASFSIYFDKPFKTGDFIIVGEDMGTVKHIGIKSTRIESLWGEEIVLPNKQLTETRVHNLRRMDSRRLVFSFGVVYQTNSEQLRKIPEIVKDIMGALDKVSLDRVHFKKFGESALEFETMYTLASSDYTVYMDTQQEINLQLKERLEREGIEFAHPTRTVFLHK